MAHRPDILETLKAEKKYYEEQLRRISIAISAIEGNFQPTHINQITEINFAQDNKFKAKTGVKWTSVIISTLKESNSPLSKDKLLMKLEGRGISRDIIDASSNTILGTLSRLSRKKEILKDGDFYRFPH
jgi:hypothetical protein